MYYLWLLCVVTWVFLYIYNTTVSHVACFMTNYKLIDWMNDWLIGRIDGWDWQMGLVCLLIEKCPFAQSIFYAKCLWRQSRWVCLCYICIICDAFYSNIMAVLMGASRTCFSNWRRIVEVMENEYGITVTNKYSLFLSGDEDLLQVLQNELESKPTSKKEKQKKASTKEKEIKLSQSNLPGSTHQKVESVDQFTSPTTGDGM